ncbi:phage tail protein [Salmonella enterica]|nr:phage tail protein [Salmonella enterica subsp. enterica serovar Infantis]EHO6576547.1 phage tail protein [Salmonella enterica]EHO3085202.1 phage tail protein [Salmonella enterica subsp. enterica serovar Infantis]EHV4805444.1 phage tail protein [Salmonella enterica subsp. enterica serovar Infantis]EIF0622171.1 phage tail protein [Salmonella enterica]
MAQSVITSAFEHLKAQEAAGGNRIIIDQFVFANIPGLNVTDTPPESEPLPPDRQIVHRQAVDRNGVVNENTVAYSVTLPESTGDFTFNWLGLVSSATNTLCMAVYLHPQEKIKTTNGKQGNTLIYSEIMEYAGASAATGITTPVSTWQIDFTARLHGMDEATRKAALDIYGPGLFLDDAFKLTAQATGQATFAPGIAYLRGLRVELGVPGTLTYSTGILQTVYIDAALTGTLTGENKATFSLTSQKSADYIDSLGFAHYVEPVATISASGEITDIRKTRKPLNDRLDGEYLTRNGNLKEIADKGEQAQSAAREHVGLGNSATRNVGTTPGTVAAGDDSRITGAMQKDQNGADIPDKPGFIKNVGLKETLNPTKRVSIGNIGTGAFDGSTPSINIGDSDSGFIGSADGVLDVYCNNAKVGYIDNAGLHMLAGIATNGNVVLQNDAREHIIIQNADGTPRMFIYKDKGGDGVHLNNGNDASTEYLFHNDGSFYAPLAVRAGGSKKLAVQANDNSTLSAMFNLWGNANRPTVIELDDDQGWHLYSQRNTDGSILFTVNGDIMANRKLNVGDATFSSDGNVNGSLWGGWLNDWINNNLVRAVRLGPVALSGGLWRDYQLGGGQVVTGFHTDGDWEMQGGDDKVYYRPIQYLIGTQWVTAPSV